MDHECRAPDYCWCSSTALEPDESCPIHGGALYPINCMICGRFMPTKKQGARMDGSTCIMCEERECKLGSALCEECDSKLSAPKSKPKEPRVKTGPRPPSSPGYVPPRG